MVNPPLLSSSNPYYASIQDAFAIIRTVSFIRWFSNSQSNRPTARDRPCCPIMDWITYVFFTVFPSLCSPYVWFHYIPLFSKTQQPQQKTPCLHKCSQPFFTILTISYFFSQLKKDMVETSTMSFAKNLYFRQASERIGIEITHLDKHFHTPVLFISAICHALSIGSFLFKTVPQ